MNRNKQFRLLGMNLDELTALAVEHGQASYRGQQLFEALYHRRVTTPADISNLPSDFRNQLLEKGDVIGLPAIERKFSSSDGTVRYLINLEDGQTVETVWMPEGDGGEAGDGTEVGDQLQTLS